MKLLLSVYDFEKLMATVNGICLSVLIVLYDFLIKNNDPDVITLLFAVLIAVIISLIIALLWTRKTERMLVESGEKYWNARGIGISLCISFACTLVGILTIVTFPKRDIAVAAIIGLSYCFGADVGRLIKIVFSYKREHSGGTG